MLYIVAGKVTDSVSDGFLPAAARLGLDVTILTDRPDDHRASRPSARVVECDVTDARAVVATVARAGAEPSAVFSNSDHLQVPTALAADFFGLPGKDWRAALKAKNKALMRRALGDVPAFEVPPGARPEGALTYPCVVKPREGVASEDVFYVADAAALRARCAEIQGRRPGETLLVEEFLPGDLHTLETLGDGTDLRLLGSFATRVSPPPYFVEERLDWAPPPPESGQVLAALAALGVGFGACHTEFVVAGGRARIVEVNYRIIGDHCDFLLADLLGVPIFEWILRVHLGERVPPVPTTTRHATVDYVLAGRGGTLAAAPGMIRNERLSYRPMRRPGTTAELTRTNRDYLGAIRAIGPDRASVETLLADFRAEHRWEIVR